ncbi:MAG: ExsB family transcriptional regulator [Methanobacteriota archaeon]|nr:MAG: ExsB family transcriptional regulator [Euryarchaeota archaeon]
MTQEIKASELNAEEFIAHQVEEIRNTVGDGIAINALSGGVDSSVVTMIGHRAVGDQLKTYFIDHGMMREGEPEYVKQVFENLGVNVVVYDAKEEFYKALEGIEDPEEKREAITRTFYKTVFGGLVRETGAKFLLHGTILTDVDETVAGIKRQHNILAQIGVDTEKEFGYHVLEPLIQLRKEGVRIVAEAVGLPEEIYNRMPFLGPALAGRVIGEVTPARIATVRAATTIIEEELAESGAFQYMAILHKDRVTGMRGGGREFGQQIELRCWESIDARTATPTRVPYETLEKMATRIIGEVPGIVSVTYNITPKPPSTMEAI